MFTMKPRRIVPQINGLDEGGAAICAVDIVMDARPRHGFAVDRELADIFLVQDEITDAVTVAVAPAIDDAEATSRPSRR